MGSGFLKLRVLLIVLDSIVEVFIKFNRLLDLTILRGPNLPVLGPAAGTENLIAESLIFMRALLNTSALPLLLFSTIKFSDYYSTDWLFDEVIQP